MFEKISIRRGLDLRLKGAVGEEGATRDVAVDRIAMVPDDFPGFTPRVCVKPGQQIAAGSALMIDKLTPEMAIVSPIGGTIEDVVRGERRKVLRIVVKSDNGDTTVAMASDPAKDLRNAIMRSGLWVMMRQLPYDIVPDPQSTPRDIFITTFDSAPLATSLMNRVAGKEKEIEAGIKALLSLTEGKIYIGIRNCDGQSALWDDINHIDTERIAVVEVGGPHPAGLASILVANTAPVNKGETVWMLDIETAARIGQVATTGRCDWSTVVAVTGSEIKTPCQIKTIVGAEIAPLLAGEVNDTDYNKRIIAGNVLTGVAVGKDGFLRYPYRQLTVIPEGDDVDEFMGWASLSPSKMSESRSFLSKLFGGRVFSPDARLNGGRRAMIMSGQYDKVFPMTIIPEYLIKAILSRDIDKMEALGIYEVTPADFALCEYVDPSKLELQKIVRQGLDYLRKELS